MEKKFFLLWFQLFCVALANGQNQWEWLNPRPSGYSYVKLVFTDRLTGSILNGNGDLIKTADQGNSWHNVGNFPRATSMDIRDSTGIIASITGGVYLSSDNGNTWESIMTDT